jgi:hypothetical protein
MLSIGAGRIKTGRSGAHCRVCNRCVVAMGRISRAQRAKALRPLGLQAMLVTVTQIT